MLRYLEIKRSLMDRIRQMQEGERLPSRTRLCRELDTTRTTIDKAIRELVEENVLASRKGSGTFVLGMPGAQRRIESWCVIVPDVREDIYNGLLHGVEEYARERGINVILCNSGRDPRKQNQYITRMMHSYVSGFIIVPTVLSSVTESARLYQSLLDSRIPFVFCNRNVEGIHVPVVTSNDFYGGYIAAKHLIGQGYRRIAYIAGNPYTTSVNRCQGYISALLENGMEVRRRWILFARDAGVQETADALLDTGERPDAIFCFNDKIASQVAEAVKGRGLRISDDVGLIGYDNTEACMGMSPPLTSVSYRFAEIGAKAAEILDKRIRHQYESDFDYYLFQPEICRRGSCLGKC